jgi:hypothetical protein
MGFGVPKRSKNRYIEKKIFFLKKGHVGYKKNPSFYVDLKNVNLP